MSMNMVNMPGPDHARNFFDAQIAHNKRQDAHNVHVEWMMFASLLQQERMIHAQNQQMQQLQEMNQIAERNRRVDLYSEELKYRGYGPLEAQNIANSELEYVELMEYVTNFALHAEQQRMAAEDIVREETTIKMGIFPTKKYKSKIEIKRAASDLRDEIAQNFQNVLKNAAYKLNNMPCSVLFDDSAFRSKIQNESGIIVKMPSLESENKSSELFFLDEEVSNLYAEYKDIRLRWHQINSAEDWEKAKDLLPLKFHEQVDQLTVHLESINTHFLNLKVIAEDGGYSLDETSKYIVEITDSLNNWQEKSNLYIQELEEYIISLGDSPVGKRLHKLVME